MPAKVAIITRTKNRTLFLKRAIESVLGQSYRDWVHVVVNDGGDAGALDALLESYHEQYAGRLVTVHLETSEGMQNAANRGLEAAESEFVSIHDDDDTWEPSFLETLTAYLDEQGPDSRYQGVVSMSTKVTEKVEGGEAIHVVNREDYIPLREVSLFRIGYENPFPPIALLYRRKVHEVIGYFNQRYDYAGDLDFNVRFLMQYEIGVIQSKLANYHWRTETDNAVYENTVTGQSEKHSRLLNELLNDYLRLGKSESGEVVGLGINVARFLVEQQWRIAAIQEMTARIDKVHVPHLIDLSLKQMEKLEKYTRYLEGFETQQKLFSIGPFTVYKGIKK